MSKILIVGSDEALVRQLTRLFANEGHELAVASDGAAGLGRLQLEAFDLIFLDHDAPGLDGLQRSPKSGGPGSRLR